MINHVRTLILNLPRAADDPSGEFIDKDFSPIQLTGHLYEMYTVLFSGKVTREMNNVRVRYYMSLLHTPEFRKYLKWYDPRLTYEPVYKDGDFGRNGLAEFESIYNNLSAVVNKSGSLFLTSTSFDETLRTSLLKDYGQAITDQDKFKIILYFYAMRLEAIRRGT